MAGQVTELSPVFFDKYNENSILILTESDLWSKFITVEDYVVAKHSGGFCTSPTCSYHILIHDSQPITVTFLQQFKSLTFRHLEVDSFYYFYKYFISGEEIVASRGKIMQSIAHALHYTNKHSYMEYRPSEHKKRLLRKKSKVYRPENPRTKSVSIQTPERSLDKRISQLLRSKFGLSFVQIIDCLVDNIGSIDNDQIHFFVK